MSSTSLCYRGSVLATVAALAAVRPAGAETYLTFSALKGYDTYASSINAAGVITGSAAGDNKSQAGLSP